jgi:hypothetical protein
MLQLILMFAALVAVLVFPVMFAARMVGAERTAFGSALLAVILQIVLSGLVEQFAPDQLIAVVIAIIGGSAIYSFTLSTTLLKGFLISIIATAIAVVAIVLLASSFAVIANAT